MKRPTDKMKAKEDILFPTDSIIGAQTPVGFFCYKYRGYGIDMYTPNIPLLSFTNYPAIHEQRIGPTVEVELDGIHPLEGLVVRGKGDINLSYSAAAIARIYISLNGDNWTALSPKAEIHTQLLPIGVYGEPHDEDTPYYFYFALPRTGVRARYWRFTIDYNPSANIRYNVNNFAIYSLEGGFYANQSEVVFDFNEFSYEELVPGIGPSNFYDTIMNVGVTKIFRTGAPPEIAFYRMDDTLIPQSEAELGEFPKTEFLDLVSCKEDKDAFPDSRYRHASQIYRDGFGIGVPFELSGVLGVSVPNVPNQERAEHFTFGLCDDPSNGIQIDNLNTAGMYSVANRLGGIPNVIWAVVNDNLASAVTQSYMWYSGIPDHQARFNYNFYPQNGYPEETNFVVTASSIQVYRDNPNQLVKIIALVSNDTICTIGTYVGTGAQQEITVAMPIQAVFIKSLETAASKIDNVKRIYNFWMSYSQSIDEGRIDTGDPYTFEVGISNQNVNQAGITYLYVGFNALPGSIYG